MLFAGEVTVSHLEVMAESRPCCAFQNLIEQFPESSADESALVALPENEMTPWFPSVMNAKFFL